MSHFAQAAFVSRLKHFLPELFHNRKVLEVGSLDVNGTVRTFFQDCDYLGIDVGPGRGVDLVAAGHLFDAGDDTFDTVISCEVMEHDPFWAETFANMTRLAAPGGAVIVTCASRGRTIHGTPSASPDSSPHTVAAGWGYYRNLDAEDFRRAHGLLDSFGRYAFFRNWRASDLYFVGVKAPVRWSGRQAGQWNRMLLRLRARYAGTALSKGFLRSLTRPDPSMPRPSVWAAPRMPSSGVAAPSGPGIAVESRCQESSSAACPCCGSKKPHTFAPVLWPRLIEKWELAPREAAVIDRQQGEACPVCHCNLRSMALAQAICRLRGFEGPLVEWARSPDASASAVLEINEAGGIASLLKRLPQHSCRRYPDIDMKRMGYPDGSFDMVIHSDTLEHVDDPVQALRECRRVLKQGGCCVFTVPVVEGRRSRSRKGLPLSYHGSPGTRRADYVVHTEFGGDAWTYVVAAEFSEVRIFPLSYPRAVAIAGIK